MNNLNNISRDVRKNIVSMHSRAKEAHIGSALSIVEILTVLYFRILKSDKRSMKNLIRDRVILSKGHAASALYAVLFRKGILPKKYIATYCLDGGKLCGHSDDTSIPGIETATGSLGHGLPIGCGMALAARNEGKKSRIFVLMGDGECNEGSVWESAMFAAHYRLDNLVVIVDRNHLQGLGSTEDVMGLEPLVDKWRSFGWRAVKINGHDMKEIETALKRTPFIKNVPSVIIAETKKGRGVSFMENRMEWHYKSPDEGQMNLAFKELDNNTM